MYGSYADGTHSENSDFDCMVIVDKKTVSQDNSFVSGIQLDLFIYSLDEIINIDNIDDFVQLYDAQIIKDTDNIASNLVMGINDHISKNSEKSAVEKSNLKSWVVKMLRRAEQNDTEGLFRYHWLLTDSLEIYFILRNMYYFGPKKSIAYLKKNDATAYALFDSSLKTVGLLYLKEWITYVVAEEID